MKKWDNDEINKLILLNLEGLKYNEIGNLLNRTAKSIRLKLNRLGYKYNDNTYHIEKLCECCNKVFKSHKSENRKYCSQSCACSINNKKYPKRTDKIFVDENNKLNEIEREIYLKTKIKYCSNCGKITKNKYCSNSCQKEYQQKKIEIDIENGSLLYSPKQYKKYLINKYGNKCMECGWNKINPLTGNVPIELEHKDGNSENNLLYNLSLLCPNCHSLTPTFRALNKGNGKHSRMDRYNSGKSY